MIKLLRFCVVFVSLFVICGAGTVSSKGTSFLLAFQDAFTPSNGFPGFCRIILTAGSTSARVTVEAPLLSTTQQVTVAASSSAVVDLNTTIYRMTPGATENKGISISSNAAISVYAVNQGDYSTDGTIVFPTSMLGNEYIVSSFEPHVYDSYISVVASAASTTVEFYKPDFVSVHVLNSSVTLNQYQTYLFYSSVDDLTGWKVKSTSNVAVFSGHSLTELPVVSLTAAGTNTYINQGSMLWEMMPPFAYWETEYVIPATPKRATAGQMHQYIRIIASEATNVYLTEYGNNFTTNMTIAQAGEWLTFNSTLDETEHVTCSVACLVVHYMTDYSYDASNGAFTDPAMTVITPTAYYSGSYVLGGLYIPTVGASAVSPSSVAWDTYVVLIASSSEYSSITVQGPSTSYSSLNWTQVNNTDYYTTVVSSIPMSTSTSVSAIQVDCSTCFAMLAGFAFGDSYAYVGGWSKTTPDDEAASSGFNIIIVIAIVVGLLVIGAVVGIVIYLKKKKAQNTKTGSYEAKKPEGEGAYRPRTSHPMRPAGNVAGAPDAHYAGDDNKFMAETAVVTAETGV